MICIRFFAHAQVYFHHPLGPGGRTRQQKKLRNLIRIFHFLVIRWQNTRLKIRRRRRVNHREENYFFLDLLLSLDKTNDNLTPRTLCSSKSNKMNLLYSWCLPQAKNSSFVILQMRYKKKMIEYIFFFCLARFCLLRNFAFIFIICQAISVWHAKQREREMRDDTE